MSAVKPAPDLGALRDVQLAEGFAVAASSYRQPGWAVFKTNQDLRALVDVFSAEFGAPREIILYGGSLGGLVSVAAIEKGRLGNVVGALSFCGVLAGSRNWDAALDLRLTYDHVCREVKAARIPGGATGLRADSRLTETDVAAAVNACTGVDLPAAQRSGRQRRNLRELTRLSQIPESFVQTVMWYATFGLRDLVHSRDKLRGRLGVSNVGVDYGDARLDAGIERIDADRKGQRKLRKNFTPKGKVGDAKIIALHTDKDGLVLMENLREYAERVPVANLTTAVVVEAIPSHCFFSPTEVLGAWESLLTWIESGEQPSAGDLQDRCQSLAPFLGGPCRIEPGFAIPDMDGRVRPR